MQFLTDENRHLYPVRLTNYFTDPAELNSVIADLEKRGIEYAVEKRKVKGRHVRYAVWLVKKPLDT